MENFEDRFEVLHLESDDNVDFDFPPFLNEEYEEEDDHFRAAKEGIVDPFCLDHSNAMPSSGIWQST